MENNIITLKLSDEQLEQIASKVVEKLQESIQPQSKYQYIKGLEGLGVYPEIVDNALKNIKLKSFKK